MNNHNIDEFIKSRNDAYTNELFPYMTENASLNEDILDDDPIKSFGNIVGAVFGKSTARANYIALKHLEAYHQWLLQNYELVPKK